MAMLLLFCVVFMTVLGVVGIHYSMYFSIRSVGAGGAGSAKYHQILAGQLTLSQPGGRLCQPHYCPSPPRIFRLSYGPEAARSIDL